MLISNLSLYVSQWNNFNAVFQADLSFCQNGFLINHIRLAFGAYGTKHATRAKMIEGYLTGKMLNVHVL